MDQGTILHYALIFLFSALSLGFFIYFWKKGQLNMDEEPKHTMMRDDDDTAS